MRPPIDGGTILVTGASSGIGRAMAEQLAPRAGKLVLVARREDRLRQLADRLRTGHPELEVVVAPCDLTDREATDRMLAHVAEAASPVDVLVNSAGLGQMGPFDASDWGHLEQMLELNVRALVYLTHRLLPSMVARRRGGVLNVSSGFGLEWMPGFAGYVGSKHFVSAFSESIRAELRDRGVVVTHLCPGPVATEFVEAMGNAPRDVPGFLRMSPERCARIGLSAFDRGRARSVPGVLLKVLIGVGSVSPQFMRRLIYRPIGPRLRALMAPPSEES